MNLPVLPHSSRMQVTLECYHHCTHCGATWGSPRPPWSVCPVCAWHFPYAACDRVSDLMDEGSWHPLETEPHAEDPLVFSDRMGYRERLARARADSGVDEALMVGSGRIEGYAVVVAVFSFSFIGGSMGIAVGQRFVEAVHYARAHRQPLLVFVASGGARMQEGAWSLVQMGRVNAALARLQAEGLGYLTCLCHPTTGGVAASLAMLGDWVFCEPGAYVSFTGARVLGVRSKDQCSDPGTLLALGHIDAIVPRSQQKSYISERLAWYAAPVC